jgi:hypothetical protein
MEFGLGIGASSYAGDLIKGYNLSTAEPALGVHYRLNFSEIVSARFHLTYGGVRGDDNNPIDVLGENRNHSFNSSYLELAAVVEYHFLNYKDVEQPQKWSPYVFGGFGFMRLNNPSDPDADFSRTQPVIPFGLGLKHRVGKRFVVELEGGARKTFFDQIDGISDGDVTIKDYQFGNPNDNDWYFFTGIRFTYVLHKIPCPFPYIPNRSMYRR